MKKYKLAIVGATGLVGRTALKILEEKNIPNLEYTLFSSKKSAGTELKFMNTRYLVHELKDFSFDEHFEYYKNLGFDKKEIIKKIAKDRGLNKNKVYMKFLEK